MLHSGSVGMSLWMEDRQEVLARMLPCLCVFAAGILITVGSISRLQNHAQVVDTIAVFKSAMK